MSDYGPRRDTWDSYGGGGRRRGGGRYESGDWGGRRRSDDLGPPRSSTFEDWNKPLPRNERLERWVHVATRVKHVRTMLCIDQSVHMYVYVCFLSLCVGVCFVNLCLSMCVYAYEYDCVC